MHQCRFLSNLFALLRQAQQLYADTNRTFDVTVGPLMQCWEIARASGSLPTDGEIADAMQTTGMHLVHLDEGNRTVRYARLGVEIDFGAIGKGYAIEEAARILRKLGITCAFLHGGTSSVVALGTPPDQPAWKVAIASPNGDNPLAVCTLHNEALSVSAPSGKSFSRRQPHLRSCD